MSLQRSFYFLILSTMVYKGINSGTNIGTKIDRIKPVENERMAVSLLVLADIIGNVVSIAVAPAGDMASMKPMHFAMMGIRAMAKISRTTLVRNANTESSDEYGAMMIDDNVYHPMPEPMAPASCKGYPKRAPMAIAPAKLPMATPMGTRKNKMPVLLIS